MITTSLIISIIIGFCVITLIWAGLFVVVLSLKFNKSLPKIITNPFTNINKPVGEEEEFATDDQILESWKTSFDKRKKNTGVEESNDIE